jgi:hypothetical protein
MLGIRTVSARPGAWGAVLAVCLTSWIGAAPLRAEGIAGTGLAFPDPLPDEGDALELVGNISLRAETPFPFDPDQYEYTWTLNGPVCYEIEEIAPGIRNRRLTFGVLEIRRDAARNAEFTIFPPNGIVPSHFHDGEVLLMGIVTDLTVWEGFQIVTAKGDLLFQGGSVLGDLERQEWQFRAAITPYGPEIPSGYGSHWGLDLVPHQVVGVERATWGGIKALYR